MTITIYKDSNANAIFIEDANGAQFLNSLHASIDGPTCTVSDLARDIEIISQAEYDDFLDEQGNTYGNNATEVCNALNAIFVASGTPSTNIPNITSSLAVSIVTGETLNYELSADYGVGYEWDLSSVPGVVTVEGNVRKLIGGSSLIAGSYNIPVKAINYNGEDSETIILTVSSPPFSNTKSIQFNNQDYLSATASTSNPLYRPSNGSGDAWTISFWFKAGTSGNQNQSIISFGGSDEQNEGQIWIKHNGQGSNDRIVLFYGTDFNNLELETPNGSVTVGVWEHWIITFDGGTTGSASGSINDYYSRFSIYKNGSLESTTNSHNNYGFGGAIVDDLFYLARRAGAGNYLRNSARIDEVALWASDESANVAAIYNSGSPHDLSLLSSAPDHWWRMGDGDTYPAINDNNASLNFTMVNMTSADIVSDVP